MKWLPDSHASRTGSSLSLYDHKKRSGETAAPKKDRFTLLARTLYLIRWTPVTTQFLPNMSMTVLRASLDDSACTVMSLPES